MGIQMRKHQFLDNMIFFLLLFNLSLTEGNEICEVQIENKTSERLRVAIASLYGDNTNRRGLNTVSPNKERAVRFRCNKELESLQVLSAHSLDKSITYFEEEIVEVGRLYHLMQEAGGFFLEEIGEIPKPEPVLVVGPPGPAGPPGPQGLPAPKEENFMVRYELKHAVPPGRTIDWDKQDFKIGFASPSSGIFIIPKSGWYNISVRLNTNTAGGFNAALKKNNKMILKLNNGKWETTTGDIITYCYKGNTISVVTLDAGTMMGSPLHNSIYLRLLF